MAHLIQKKWEKKATVRNRPRITVNPQEKGYFFPLSHQPLCAHPTIQNLGQKALHYLLVQSFYKYSNDIATIETRVVNQTILMAMTDTLPIGLSCEQKLNLLSIMVDESYHAYVAYDARLQIEAHTGIAALPLPKVIEIEKALEVAKKILPTQHYPVFQLFAVCMAENTLTKDIVTMRDQNETHPFFQKIIQDHLADESRHAGIFFHLLRYLWQRISQDCRKAIADSLPVFLAHYLGVTLQKSFGSQIMIQLGLSPEEANQILDDTYTGFQLTPKHPMLKNIVIQFEKAGIMPGPIKNSFQKHGWLETVSL